MKKGAQELYILQWLLKVTRIMVDRGEWKTYPVLDLQGHSTMPPACDHKNPIQLAFPRHPHLSAVVSIDSPANGTNWRSISFHTLPGSIPLTIGKSVPLLAANSLDRLKANELSIKSDNRDTYILAYGDCLNLLDSQSARTRVEYPIAVRIVSRQLDLRPLSSHHQWYHEASPGHFWDIVMHSKPVCMWIYTFEPQHPTYERYPMLDLWSSGYLRYALPFGNEGTFHQEPDEVLPEHLSLDLCVIRIQSLRLV